MKKSDRGDSDLAQVLLDRVFTQALIVFLHHSATSTKREKTHREGILKGTIEGDRRRFRFGKLQASRDRQGVDVDLSTFERYQWCGVQKVVANTWDQMIDWTPDTCVFCIPLVVCQRFRHPNPKLKSNLIRETTMVIPTHISKCRTKGDRYFSNDNDGSSSLQKT